MAENIVSIANLNPYSSWTIKARVTNKSQVRTWSNDKGAGKLFSVDLVDASGEIKCTCFNDAVDLFEPIFQVNQVYMISKGTVKQANSKFTKCEFEMSLSKNSVVKQVQEQSSSLPKIRYSFTAIDALTAVPADQLVDVLGVICEIGDLGQITTKKDSRTITKRGVTIVDSTFKRVEVILWAEKAENFDHAEGTMVALKNVRVGEFQGSKNLSVTTTSQMDFNPSLPGSKELAYWYAQNRDKILAGAAPTISATGFSGGEPATQSTLQVLADEAALLASDKTKTAYKKVLCTLLWIKHDESSQVIYKAVPMQKQRHKVEEQNGRYYCASTRQYYDTYIPRFMVTVLAADCTCSQFFTVFDDFGPDIFGLDARALEQLSEGPNANQQKFNAIFEAALYKRFLFKLKAKEEFYGESQKLRIVVGGVEKIDYAEQSRSLIENIVALHGNNE